MDCVPRGERWVKRMENVAFAARVRVVRKREVRKKKMLRDDKEKYTGCTAAFQHD